VTVETVVLALASAVEARVTPELTLAIKSPEEVYKLMLRLPVVLILFGFRIWLKVIIFVVEAEVLELEPEIVTTELVFVLKEVPLVNNPIPV
jgi:hypothetical protein